MQVSYNVSLGLLLLLLLLLQALALAVAAACAWPSGGHQPYADLRNFPAALASSCQLGEALLLLLPPLPLLESGCCSGNTLATCSSLQAALKASPALNAAPALLATWVAFGCKSYGWYRLLLLPLPLLLHEGH